MTESLSRARRLYGHRDRQKTLDRVVAAYGQRGNVVPLLRIAESA